MEEHLWQRQRLQENATLEAAPHSNEIAVGYKEDEAPVCRLCSNHSEKFIGIYSEEGLANDLGNKMNLYLPIRVSENDSLPLQCCWSCATTIFAWHELVVATVETDRRLRELQVASDVKEQLPYIVDENLGLPMPENDDGDAGVTDDVLETADASLTAFCHTASKEAEAEAKDERDELPVGKKAVSSPVKKVCTGRPRPRVKRKVKPRPSGSPPPSQPNDNKDWAKQVNTDESLADYIITEETGEKEAYDNPPRVDVFKNELKYDPEETTADDSDDNEDDDEHDHDDKKHCKEEDGGGSYFKAEWKTLEVAGATEKSDNKADCYNFQCQYCDKVFVLEEEVLSHTQQDHSEKAEELLGNIESQDEEQQTRRQQQKRRRNTKIDQDQVNAAKVMVEGRVYYNCKICGKSLHSPYTYIWHMRIHTGERPYVCDLCGKQFRVSQGLVRHLRETHEGIKNFPCDLCGRMFATRRNVEEHRRIHTNERPYICDLCGKAFKQKASLFVHGRSHTDTFPFRCSYCDQGFRTKPPLMIHITRHTGEKPYPCDVCGRCFRIKYELKRHRLIHSDEKPFSCTDCGLSFRQKRYLRNHNKINHNNRTIA